MDTTSPSPLGFFRRRVSWITIVLGLLALGTFAYIYSTRTSYSPFFGVSRSDMMESGPGAINSYGTDAVAPSAPAMYPNPYPTQGVPATDTASTCATVSE